MHIRRGLHVGGPSADFEDLRLTVLPREWILGKKVIPVKDPGAIASIVSHGRERHSLAHLIIPALLVVHDVEIHDFPVESPVNDRSSMEVSHG